MEPGREKEGWSQGGRRRGGAREGEGWVEPGREKEGWSQGGRRRGRAREGEAERKRPILIRAILEEWSLDRECRLINRDLERQGEECNEANRRADAMEVDGGGRVTLRTGRRINRQRIFRRRIYRRRIYRWRRTRGARRKYIISIIGRITADAACCGFISLLIRK